MPKPNRIAESATARLRPEQDRDTDRSRSHTPQPRLDYDEIISRLRSQIGRLKGQVSSLERAAQQHEREAEHFKTVYFDYEDWVLHESRKPIDPAAKILETLYHATRNVPYSEAVAYLYDFHHYVHGGYSILQALEKALEGHSSNAQRVAEIAQQQRKDDDAEQSEPEPAIQ